MQTYPPGVSGPGRAAPGHSHSRERRLVTLCANTKKLVWIGIFLSIANVTLAQHPLIGTWEMVSIQGINVDGERFSIDSSTVRETKIITPSHYMLIARDVRGDSLIFNRCYAGTITIDGNQYNESPLQASVQIFDNVKTNFTWKVEGDTFTQAGTFTRPDGKEIVLEAMVFRRVNLPQSYPDNPAIGTWSQLSSSFTNFDGTKASHTRETTQRLQVITPTHWMRISHTNNKFEHAMGGTYVLKKGKTYPVVTYSSAGFPSVSHLELVEKVKGNQLTVSGQMKGADGKTFTWQDLFERVK